VQASAAHPTDASLPVGILQKIGWSERAYETESDRWEVIIAMTDSFEMWEVIIVIIAMVDSFRLLSCRWVVIIAMIDSFRLLSCHLNYSVST